MQERPPIPNRCRRIFPFFILSLLVAAVSAFLLLSLQTPQRHPPWGHPGTFIIAYSSSNVKPERLLQDSVTLMDNSTVKFNTTTVVLFANQSYVELVTIIGNVTVEELGASRLLAGSDNEGVNFSEVPMLRTTANLVTGAILTVDRTNGTDDLSSVFALNTVREILVNQDVASYGNINAKRVSADPIASCEFEENLYGEVFCPDFSVLSTSASSVYRKEYTTDSAKSRRLTENADFSMRISIETAVNSQTGYVQQASTSGNIDLAVFKTDNNTSMITLSHNSSTTFEIRANSATPQDLSCIRSIMSASNFSSFNSSLAAALNTTGNSRVLTERDLAAPQTSSKSIKLFTLFGVNVNALTVMTINSDSMRIRLILDFAGILQYALADETFGGPVVQSVWKVLGLRDLAKSKLEALQTSVLGFVKEIQDTMKGGIFAKVNEVKAQIDAIKQSYMNTIQQLQGQLNGYKEKVQGVADSIKVKYEKSVEEGKQKLEAIKSDVDASISDIKSNAQSELDTYSSKFEDAKSQVTQITTDIEKLRSEVLSTDQLKRIADNTDITNLYTSKKEEYLGKLNTANAQIATFIDQETTKVNTIISEATAIVDRTITDAQSQADVLVQKFEDGFDAAVGELNSFKASALTVLDQIQADIDTASAMVDSPEKIARLANLTDYFNLYTQKKTDIESNLTDIQSKINQFAAQQQVQVNAIIQAAESLAQQNITDLRQALNQKISQYQLSLQPTIDMYQGTISDASAKIASAKQTVENVKNEVLKTPEEIAKMTNLTTYAQTYESKRTELQSNLDSVMATISSFAKEKRVGVEVSIANLKSSVSQAISDIEQDMTDEIQAYKATFADNLADLSTKLASVTATITVIQGDINTASALADSQEKLTKMANLTSTLATYQSKSNQLQTSITAIQTDISSFETAKRDEFALITAPLRQELDTTITNERLDVEQEIADFTSAKQAIIDDFTSLLSVANAQASQISAGILELRDSLCSAATLTKIANATNFLDLYETKKAEAEKMLTAFTKNITDFIEEKKAAGKAILASVQSAIDETQAKLTAIASGSFSWQEEFEKAGMTLIDDILEPFKQAKSSFQTAISQVTTLATVLKSVVSDSAQSFKGKVSGASSDVSSGFNNIAGQKATAAQGDANIFDFSFFETLFSSIKDSLKTVSSTISGVKDLLDGSLLDIIKDATNILNPDQWLSIFGDLKREIADLQSKYKYLKSAPDIGEQWLKETVDQLKAMAVDELKKVNIADVASSLAPTLTNSLMSGIADMSKIKDKLISDFLGKVLIPPKRFNLFRFGPFSTPLGPPIPTPIGPIIISWGYDIKSDIVISISLDSNQLAASVDPGIAANFAVMAGWNIVIAEVGAMAGVSLGGDLPFSVGMKRQTRGIFINGDLNYYANGKFGLYYKYIYPVLRVSCWSIRIGRIRIKICIVWFTFQWSSPKMFLGASIGTSGTLTLLRKSF